MELQTRREQVRVLLDKGKPVREIAVIMGTSTQAVYDHISALRRSGYVWPKDES